MKHTRKKGHPSPSCVLSFRLFSWILPESGSNGLQGLNVRSLPTLGPLHHVELHSLTFLQTLESAGVDCRVMHEYIFAVLTRDKTKTLRVVKPLHSTLFHFDRVSWIELRWMNRSDDWQKSCLVGRVLLTPGSTLTLMIVYHPVQKGTQKFSRLALILSFLFWNLLTNMHLVHFTQTGFGIAPGRGGVQPQTRRRPRAPRRRARERHKAVCSLPIHSAGEAGSEPRSGGRTAS